jgi:hypothetical protein
MTKQKIGATMHLASYGALAGAGIAAGQHPVIIALLVVGAGLLILGRMLEKSA